MNIQFTDDQREVLGESLCVGLNHYLIDHIRPGGFLYAVLTNDLLHAVLMADSINRRKLPDIVTVIFDVASQGSWGNVEKVETWLDNQVADCAT